MAEFDVIAVGFYTADNQDWLTQHMVRIGRHLHVSPERTDTLHYLVCAYGYRVPEMLRTLAEPSTFSADSIPQDLRGKFSTLHVWHYENRKMARKVFADIVLEDDAACWILQRRPNILHAATRVSEVI